MIFHVLFLVCPIVQILRRLFHDAYIRISKLYYAFNYIFALSCNNFEFFLVLNVYFWRFQQKIFKKIK